jgi:translocation and assembly module TamB
LKHIVDLRVSHLLIGQSDLWWDDSRLGLDLAAQNIALVLGVRKETYSGSLSASPLRLSTPERRLPPIVFATRIELARNTLALNSLTWRSAPLSGSGSVSLHWTPEPEAKFSLEVEGDAAQMAPLVHRREVREGRFTARADGTYGKAGVDARGRVDGRRLVIVGPARRPLQFDLALDYDAHGKRLEMSRVEARLLGGSFSGKASLSAEGRSPDFSADLELHGLDLASALGQVPEGPAILADFPVASRIDGKVQVSAGGQSREVGSRFDLTMQATTSGREPLSGLARGSVQFKRDTSINLEKANFDTAVSHIALQGQLSPNSSNLTFSVKTTAFEEWRRAAESWVEEPLPVKLDSTATFSGTASGTPAQPAVHGHLSVGPFEYQRWKWDGLEGEVALASNRLQVSSGRLLSAHSTLALDLTAGLSDWTFTSSSPLQLSAHANQTSIEGLREVLGITYPLSGLISGGLEIERADGRLTGRSSFQIVRGSYDGEPFDSLAARLERTGDQWRLTGGELVKAGGRVVADATYNPATRALFAHAQGKNLALADFRRLRSLRQALPADRQIAGLLGFEAEITSTLDNPAAHGSASIRQLTLGGVQFGELSTRFDWNQHQADVQGQLEGPGGRFSFHGVGTTTADCPFTVKAQYTSLRLDSLLRVSGVASPGGSIDATGSFDLSGGLRGDRAFKVNSQVEEVNVRFADLQWRNNQPFAIELADRRINVTPFELLGPATHFQVQGAADLGAPSALNFTATGEIDSALLHIFSPAVLTTGHLDVEAQVRGTLSRPSIYGSLHVHGVSLGYPGLPLHIAGLNGDIDLQGDRVTIRSLRAESGPSSLTITGGAVLSGVPRYNLRAELDSFRVGYPIQFTSVLNGSLHLSGTPEGGVLTGELAVAQMYVGENFNVLNWASALANQPAAVTAPTPALASNVRLDIHVASAPAVSVESHDLTAVASIDLNLRGTILDPVAFGSVHIQTGQAILRQASYRLSRGDIIMANPLRTEPVLDLEARTRIQRYDLILRITGPADHPNISYRSDPPLSTPSILALLAFGYTSEDQLIAASGRSNLSAQGANALLSQALSTQTSSRITRLFGLSRIGIDPNPSSLGGARVTVEEQLRRDFTITYVNTTGGIQERIIQLEWNVTDNISLLGVRDQNGVYGLELDFRHRFK